MTGQAIAQATGRDFPVMFDGALDPSGGTLRPDPARPGLGLALKESDAAQFRVA